MPKVSAKVDQKLRNNPDVSAPVDEETTPDEPKASEEVDAYDIIKGEQWIRQYSREVHGDNFKQLAESLCSQSTKGNPYKMVPSHTITHVEVRFSEKEDMDKPANKRKPDSPMVDKIVVFTDKEAALRLKVVKPNSTVVVSKRKK
jgi:hypothetical protein